MKRVKCSFRTVGLGSVIMLGLAACVAERAEVVAVPSQPKLDNSKPNVLFISVDDLRPQGSIYGVENAVTPGIKKLAKRGVTFTRAYSNVPVCGASRASLMTGIKPTKTRFRYSYTRADEDTPDAPTLGDFFKTNGYQTAAVGKVFHKSKDSADSWTDGIWHPGDDPEIAAKTSPRNYLAPANIEQDRDNTTRRPVPWENLDVDDDAYFDGKIRQKAVQKLRQFSKNDTPFFLAVGFLKPHLPFNAPKKYWDYYPEESISLPENFTFPSSAPEQAWHQYGELRNYSGMPEKGSSESVDKATATKLIQGYNASMSYSDAQLSLLLDELDELGLSDNTIIVLWGDHGWSLGEHSLWSKHSPFDVANKTSLVIAAPNAAKDVQSSNMVQLLDLYPTLADLTNIPAPDHLDGVSIKSVLESPTVEQSRYIHTRWTARGSPIHSDSIRTDKYTYTRWQNGSGVQIAHMFYDLTNDPDENNNIVEQQEYQALVGQLASKLDAATAE